MRIVIAIVFTVFAPAESETNTRRRRRRRKMDKTDQLGVDHDDGGIFAHAAMSCH